MKYADNKVIIASETIEQTDSDSEDIIHLDHIDIKKFMHTNANINVNNELLLL